MRARVAGAALVLGLLAGIASAGDVLVLKGGERIELKGPWTQQGNNAILTRSDGVVLSVPMSEVDLKATTAARKAAPARPAAVAAPAETPAEALRASKTAPKARVKVTDADVSHDSMAGLEVGGSGEKKAEAKGSARLDVAGYDQSKAGSNLIIRGSLRNFGGTAASNSRMSVSAIDENGEIIGTGEASLSKGNLESFETVAFTASIPVGDKVIASLRFAPQWVAAPPPAPPAEAAASAASAKSAAAGAAGAPAAAPASSQPPAPVPTPYGQGSLYAAPAPNASSTAPADSRTGYIPGASDPASQPKPPQ